jgi:hypothetical protein
LEKDSIKILSADILALIEEECRLNLVKAIVDSSCAIIQCGCISGKELENIRTFTKSVVMTFIPEDEDKYNLIYDNRLKRLLQQFPPKI